MLEHVLIGKADQLFRNMLERQLPQFHQTANLRFRCSACMALVRVTLSVIFPKEHKEDDSNNDSQADHHKHPFASGIPRDYARHSIVTSAEKYGTSKRPPRHGLEFAIAASRAAIEKAASRLQTAVNPAMAKWTSH
jgi:hypothetical protein